MTPNKNWLKLNKLIQNKRKRTKEIGKVNKKKGKENYVFFIEGLVFVLEGLDLLAELETLLLILLQLEDVGLELRDDQIFLVRFDLGRRKILEKVEDKKILKKQAKRKGITLE